MEQIIVVPTGDADNPNAAIKLVNTATGTKYDEPIRVPPDAKTEKFDVVWLAKGARHVVMAKGLAFDAEHPSHEIKPEEHIGLVRLGGKDLPKPKAIYLAEAGENKGTVRILHALRGEKYGQDLPVPGGSYDLYVDIADENRLELISEKLEVKPGQITEVD